MNTYTIKPFHRASKIKSNKLQKVAILSTLVLAALSSSVLAAPVFSSLTFDSATNQISIKGTGLCRTATCLPLPTLTIFGISRALTGFTQTQTELKVTWTPPFAGSFPVIVTNSGGSLTSTLTVGAVGPIGLPGTNGTNGTDGAAGAKGDIGLTGSNGNDGATGPQGIQGPIGEQGPQGLQGLIGLAGAAGTNGVDGATGPQGIQGPIGEQGPQGLQGLIGLAGAAGTNGVDGATGPQGIPGTAGSSCTLYHWGDTGPDGGKVFYVDGSGCHGLEAQSYDVGATSANLYVGVAQTWTNAISTAAAYNDNARGVTGTPGLNCSTTASPATPNCWHLPSKNELSWLYEQKTVVGGFANNNYWSATEGSSTHAFLQNFNGGGQGTTPRTSTILVRTVRAF